jgi:hypothetical protein
LRARFIDFITELVPARRTLETTVQGRTRADLQVSSYKFSFIFLTKFP